MVCCVKSGVGSPEVHLSNKLTIQLNSGIPGIGIITTTTTNCNETNNTPKNKQEEGRKGPWQCLGSIEESLTWADGPGYLDATQMRN